MQGSSPFAITPPAYAEGMIFVALGGGMVQAFNAKTLESLWLYTDSLGIGLGANQPNCPITYSDGCIYTGFWNSEQGAAHMVCLTITDEDPSQPLEAKRPALGAHAVRRLLLGGRTRHGEVCAGRHGGRREGV